MDSNTKTKITRRVFNALTAIVIFCGFKKRVTADNATDYMEILIIPEEYRYPYSDKTNQVLMNHIQSGKNKHEIKKFILSRCKVIKVPIQ